MGPFSIRQPEATVRLWLEYSGELLIEVYKPHSGSSGHYYIINSFSQYEELSSNSRPGSIFFVLREKQFHLRGVVDDQFKAMAMEMVSDGRWYLIAEPYLYPNEVSLIADGDSHSELNNDLDKLQGKEVWFGALPPTPDEYWLPNSDPDALILNLPDDK
jgi:hypothetical protein